MGLLTIDADAHICEPPKVWAEYAEPEFRDSVLQVRATEDGGESIFIEGRPTSTHVAPACIPGRFGDPDVRWKDILPGSYDPHERLKVLDDEGLDMAVMFPSTHLISGDIKDPRVAAANARAYNNWMSDFIAVDRNRLFGAGICPLQSVDEAVTEIERAAGLGMSAMTFRPERYNGLALVDPEMDRVWSAAAAADITIVIHGSFGSRMDGFARSRYQNQFYVHMVCHPFEQMAAMMEIVASGTLDRHPKLRVGFFESGIGWLPFWMERLDDHKKTMGHLVPDLKRTPTEAFAEQCFITMEAGEEKALAEVAEMGLADSVVWGSDYPHYDCTFPGALVELDKGLAAVGREDLRDKVLHHNPKRMLGLS